MSNDKHLVVSDLLCFLTIKVNKTPIKVLKSLILQFYSPQEFSEAKELLLVDIDRLNVENFPKITRHRRDSVNKYANELDDILTAITFMDNQKMTNSLSTFVALKCLQTYVCRHFISR